MVRALDAVRAEVYEVRVDSASIVVFRAHLCDSQRDPWRLHHAQGYSARARRPRGSRRGAAPSRGHAVGVRTAGRPIDWHVAPRRRQIDLFPWTWAGRRNPHLRPRAERELPGVIVDVLATTGEIAKAKEADLKAFARAWYRALDFLKSNPDESYVIMAKGVGGWIEKPEDFKAAAGGIQYLDKAANAALFGTGGTDGTLHKTVSDAIEIWKGFQKVQVEVTPKDLIEQNMYGG